MLSLRRSCQTLELIIHPEHMRLQGKIKNWNDERGYGFVEQNGGGERVFLHISAFSTRGRRPGEGDVVTYEIEGSSKGPRAVNVARVDDRAVPS